MELYSNRSVLTNLMASTLNISWKEAYAPLYAYAGKRTHVHSHICGHDIARRIYVLFDLIHKGEMDRVVGAYRLPGTLYSGTRNFQNMSD